MRQVKLYALTYEEIADIIRMCIEMPPQSTDIVVLTFADNVMKGAKADDKPNTSTHTP